MVGPAHGTSSHARRDESPAQARGAHAYNARNPSGLPRLNIQRPVIGIVGSQGAFGRWLTTFFRARMGLDVLGHDPADAASVPPDDLLQRADVLLFSTPIRSTPALIDDYVRRAGGSEAGRLWMDLTSVKTEPMAAMLGSRAEVVGLHPMTAPPKSPTLKGRVVVVCEGRLDVWRPWVQALLDALEGQCVQATPEHHDRVMALVQAMVHASHLAQAGVLREYAPSLGGLAELLPFRSASFDMDGAVIARILSQNPAIYEDIQFCNPHAAPMLRVLEQQLAALRGQVESRRESDRASFRREFLDANAEAIGTPTLAQGNHRFEQIGYLLADLGEARTLSIHLPQDRPGSLRALLHVFERHGLSLTSIHSSRTPAGDVHFRMGFENDTAPQQLQAVAAEVDGSGIGRVLPQ